METLSSRIRLVFDSVGMTKSEIARSLNVTPAYISKLTNKDDAIPSSRFISDICREFRVNEEWLRTGEGTMFLSESRSDLIASFMADVMGSAPDDIRQVIVSGLAKLDVEDWENIRDILKKIGLI